ncbi:hypothetical protein [Kitasatospora sp. NPDC089509]|uniref:hypothetical protein n=1 Tax=Kitasatospora sp. NPDC089509 TaxID=3364079 RepID=UPI003810804E
MHNYALTGLPGSRPVIATEPTSHPQLLRGFVYWDVSVSLGAVVAAVTVPVACASTVPWWLLAGVSALITTAGQARFHYRRLRLQ